MKYFIYLSTLSVILIGCVTSQAIKQSYKLSPGMAKSEVESILGPPN